MLQSDCESIIESELPEEFAALCVTESEYKLAKQWQTEHNHDMHDMTEGRFEWEFLPTCCGMVGSCTCTRCKAASQQYGTMMERRTYMKEHQATFMFRHLHKE